MTESNPTVLASHPVTPVQHGMIYHHVSEPHAGVDLEQCIGDFAEELRFADLERAFREVGARHEVLHARFRWEGLATPLLEVLAPDQVSVPVALEDLRGASTEEQRVHIERYLDEDRRAGFDFRVAPLHRVRVFQLRDNTFKAVWTYSHATLDNAVRSVLREVLDAYDGSGRGESPRAVERTPFSRHLDFLGTHLKEQAARAEAFFRAELDGFTEPTNVAPSSRADGASGQGTLDLRLDVESTDALRSLAERTGVSLAHVFQAAWSLVLGQHAAASDVVFGVTRACRRSSIAGAEDAIGLFINTLPVRLRLEPSVSVVEFLAGVRDKNRKLREFEQTSLVDVQRTSRLKAGEPLFGSIVVFNNRHNDTQLHEEGVSASRRFEWIDRTNFPVTLFGYGDPGLLLRISYRRKELDDELAATLLRQMRAVLTDMAAHPDKTLGQLRLIDEQDVARLAAFQGRDVEFEVVPIHQSFEREAAAHPDAVALTHGDRSLTYAELDSKANEVAAALRASGLSGNECVGIYVHRSLSMVVGLLGILKAGAAYVPLDPKFPRERLAMMIEDSGMRRILTPRALGGSLPVHNATLVDLEPDFGVAPPVASPAVSNPDYGVKPDDLAYVIFTSGSTGRPKGVMLEHRHVANFFAQMDARIGTERGTWLAVTSISFDISVFELLWTLSRGFHVVVHADDAAAVSGGRPAHIMNFGLFYFGGEAGTDVRNKYRLLLEGAKYADQQGFTSVWTPERHFHEFGGLYPNPALTGAAIAACTKQIHIRAGSVVAPLHDPIRLAEEWSVVDNISGGRVGLSVASGWHPNDFVVMPDNFEARRELMFEHLENALRLWRGESLTRKNGVGQDIEVQTFPRPLQREPPLWVTAGGSPVTFEKAGERGANILTNLLVQSEEELADRIKLYRQARQKAGHEGPGEITLMLHTFLGEDGDLVREIVRQPLIEYLKTATALVNRTRWELTTFATGYKSQGSAPTEKLPSLDELAPEERQAILDHAFERYFTDQGLFGTPESCRRIVDRFAAMGVTEIACLIDFGLETQKVLDSLRVLDRLRAMYAGSTETEAAAGRDFDLATLMSRHAVTHFQCTPSLCRMILSDDEQKRALLGVGTILLGGEALPLDLAREITARQRGRLLNMYGPTETTVWSASSVVPPGADGISIGTPNANTRIFVLDAEQRLVPPGAVGEIYIGGLSVARGYIGREDLTKERFLSLAPGGTPHRYYRTGDLGRFRADGTLEFLGRTDHQVKVSGYRIELGEIELALAGDPSVKEVAVVARSDEGRDAYLVAYVVPQETISGAAPSAATQLWADAWDQTYASEAATDSSSDLDTAGWISSLTGERYADLDMQTWVDETVRLIRRQAPTRVLEVGCGTGMLALRLAPIVESYTGVDVSQVALDRLGQKVRARGLSNVDLVRAAADALGGLPRGAFDTIVVNSVVQYFPGADYLLQVLEGLIPLASSRAKIVFGDVRNLHHMGAFHIASEARRLAPGERVRDLLRRLEERTARESELALAPEFFESLPFVVPGVRRAEVTLRNDRNDTEMSRYRFDAVLSVGDEPVSAPPPPETATSFEEVSRLVSRGPTELFVTDLSNDRVVRDFAALSCVKHLSTTEPDSSASECLGKLGSPKLGVVPSALLQFEDYEAKLLPARSGAADRFDVYFVRKGVQVSQRDFSSPRVAKSREALLDLANRPSHGGGFRAEALRELAARRLPPYMVPSTIVVLDAMPLTPNGKLDRAKLPKPTAQKRSAAAHSDPQNDAERVLARIWSEMLHLERISTHDNFFDLGANSLMMVQAQGKIFAQLGTRPTLVDLFRFPTVERLARHLSGETQRENESAQTERLVARDAGAAKEVSSGGSPGADASRGSARLEALRRRRSARN